MVIAYAWNDQTLKLDTNVPVKKAVPPKPPAKKVAPSKPKSAGNNSPKSPKNESQNQNIQQSVAAATQVKAEDENMKSRTRSSLVQSKAKQGT